MSLELLLPIFDAELGHSRATVQNFNDVMRKKRL